MPSLRFLLDADMPRSSARVLRDHGFGVEDVRDIGMEDAKDIEVMKHSREQKMIIITRDKKFGNPQKYPKHPGVVILRLPHTYTSSKINERLDKFLATVSVEKLPNAITIVELSRYRRRKIQE